MKSVTLVIAAALSLLAFGPVQAAAPPPTDPQIAHIAYTAGAIDIAAAKQALAKTHNPQVKAFAEEMVRDHTAVNDKALALVKKLGVTPEDNPTSQALKANADKELKKLGALSGPAFDRAYVANEVAYHKTVDNALSTTLIPSAHNPELKSLLEQGLKIFEGHEAHAEQLQHDLH
jgi:putative membrane protein